MAAMDPINGRYGKETSRLGRNQADQNAADLGDDAGVAHAATCDAAGGCAGGEGVKSRCEHPNFAYTGWLRTRAGSIPRRTLRNSKKLCGKSATANSHSLMTKGLRWFDDLLQCAR